MARRKAQSWLIWKNTANRMLHVNTKIELIERCHSSINVSYSLFLCSCSFCCTLCKQHLNILSVCGNSTVADESVHAHFSFAPFELNIVGHKFGYLLLYCSVNFWKRAQSKQTKNAGTTVDAQTHHVLVGCIHIWSGNRFRFVYVSILCVYFCHQLKWCSFVCSK